MERNSLQVDLLDLTNSSLYCDCVQFSPLFAKDKLFAVGLYQLNEEEKITKGGFCLYSIEQGYLLLIFLN